MKLSTPVHAARSGQIYAIEERFEDENRTPGQENYIYIDHGDSTFSRYYHLTKDGAIVDVGQVVKQGEQIGFSGDTGASAGPHLHFDVTRGCPEWGCQTIEITLSNVGGDPDTLSAGEEYLALPDR